MVKAWKRIEPTVVTKIDRLTDPHAVLMAYERLLELKRKYDGSAHA